MASTTRHDSWSDADLDQAVADLQRTFTPLETDLQRLRLRLIDALGAADAAPGPVGAVSAAVATPTQPYPRIRRRFRVRFVGAVLVAATVLVAGVVSLGGEPPAASAGAVEVLLSAAALTTADPTPAPGQFTRRITHSWDLNTTYVGDENSGATYSVLGEKVTTVWVPSNPSSLWTQRTTYTGNVRWNQPSAAPSPLPDPLRDLLTPQTSDVTAACGAFFGGDDFCNDPGNWQSPSRAWLASMPRDPARLYARLRRDAPSNSRGYAEYLVYAADALRTGLVPADLRTSLYKALTRLPGLTVKQHDANLDGRVGVALGIDDGTTTQELIIDAATGQFIGEREVTDRAGDGLGAGAVISSSSVSTDVVDAVGP